MVFVTKNSIYPKEFVIKNIKIFKMYFYNTNTTLIREWKNGDVVD